MPYSTQRFLSSRLLPSGRRLRVLRQLAQAIAASNDLEVISARVAAATAAIEDERRLAQAWAVQSRIPRSTAKKGDAHKLDPALDRMVAAFQKALDARLALAPPNSDSAARTAALLGEAFPFGVGHITLRAYEEQIALVYDLLRTLTDDAHAEAVTEAGLGAAVADLQAMADAFDVALGASGPDRLAYADVAEGTRRGQEAYADVLVAVLFVTAGADGEGQRERLLAGHNRQAADVAALKARGATATDVNPDTGEVEPTPSEPAVDDGD